MDAIIDFIMGEYFFHILGIVFFILVIISARIGYIAGKGRKYKPCQCKEPLLSNLLICENCEKHIEA